MQYISDFREGNNVSDVYYCKKADVLVTKAGKTYYSLILQDKTGTVDAKIWDVSNPGIEEFDAGDFVKISGRITIFQNSPQVNIDRIYQVQENQYVLADYMPCSEYDIDEMYSAMLKILERVKEPHLKELLQHFFVDDEEFIQKFKEHSAAKSIHHGFIGGLVEHTLHVLRFCEFYGSIYKDLNMNLLLTAAALHDIGKVKELSPFPTNDYTEDGQLLGHIVIGIMDIDAVIKTIDGFPNTLREELEHCIAAHHGELEYGSPKKPALMEAVALNFADNTDAKLETFKEALKGVEGNGWTGYNRLFDSNIRRTTDWK